MTGEKHIRKDLKKAVMTYRGTQSYSSVKGGEFLAQISDYMLMLLRLSSQIPSGPVMFCLHDDYFLLIHRLFNEV